KGASPDASSMLKLVDLVVERLETDTELARGGGLVAVVFFENGLDISHFDIAERGIPVGNLEMGGSNRCCSARVDLTAHGKLRGKVLGKDRSVAREDRCALDHVGQFSYVPRPVVGLEEVDRFRDDGRVHETAACRVSGEHVLCQSGDIGLAIAERRKNDLEGI